MRQSPHFTEGNFPKRNSDPNAGAQRQAGKMRQQDDNRFKQRVAELTTQPPDIRIPFSDFWFDQLDPTRKDYIRGEQAKSEEGLMTRYPFTYPIPGDQKYKIMSNYVKDDGTVMGPMGSGVIGKAFASPEYYEYLARRRDRTLAVRFKEFVFNNMDISDLIKKEYWRTRMPLYYNELIRGMQLVGKLKQRRNSIMLLGPGINAETLAYSNKQKDDDWKFLYDLMVQPDVLWDNAQGLENDKRYPRTPLPMPGWEDSKQKVANNKGVDGTDLTMEDHERVENPEDV